MPSDAVRARKRSKTPTSKGRPISKKCTNKAKKEAEEKAKEKKEAKDGQWY
jgi:hypothetical protein